MGILHAGYTFNNVDSHQMPRFAPWIYEDLTIRFFGVEGAKEITDIPHDRAIGVEVDFFGFATDADIETFMATLDSKINVLKGTLQIFNVTYANCVFKGFQRGEPMLFDGSGVNGWIQNGTLIWRQLSRS